MKQVLFYETSAILRLVCKRCGQEIRFCNQCKYRFNEGEKIYCDGASHFCNSDNCKNK